MQFVICSQQDDCLQVGMFHKEAHWLWTRPRRPSLKWMLRILPPSGMSRGSRPARHIATTGKRQRYQKRWQKPRNRLVTCLPSIDRQLITWRRDVWRHSPELSRFALSMTISSNCVTFLSDAVESVMHESYLSARRQLQFTANDQFQHRLH